MSEPTALTTVEEVLAEAQRQIDRLSAVEAHAAAQEGDLPLEPTARSIPPR